VIRRFTLLDDVYYEALRGVAEVLERREACYCLVGGGAAQAWIASLRTGDGARRIGEEPALPAALRKTRDLDFSTRMAPSEALGVLNGLAATHGPGAHVLGPRALRLGPVSVSLTLEPADLSGMEGLYDAFLESRATLRLRRGTEVEELQAIGLEELLATKLTRRGDKAKDLIDVANLMAAASEAGRAVDLNAVRRMVQGRPEAIALLDEIADRDRDEEP
jgi:hypothetical protein